MKPSISKCLVALVSLLVSLLVCELLVRVLPLRIDKTQFGVVRSHLTRGFEFIPNVSRERWGVDWNINSEGFRDYEHKLNKTAFRILGIGDSYFVGQEVSFENSFLRQLEKDLKIEVIKLAVTNYGTIQERLLWEEKGKKYDPDLVLLGVYEGNDVFDNVAFSDGRCIDRGHLVPCGDPRNAAVRLARYSARHSLLARFILQRYHWYLPQLEKKNENARKQTPLSMTENSMSQLCEAEWSSSVQEGFRLLVENVIQLNKSVVEQKASFVVVIIPTEIQIYDS